MSPEILAGWDALHFGSDNNISNGWVPPDPILSVGPTYVVEMVNLLMGVYAKDGNRISVAALSSLFQSGSDAISDPKIQYDVASGRWFASVTDISSSSILLVVSANGTPTGSWHRFSIGGSGCLDQPILGVGTTTVILSANVFSSCTGSGITYTGAEYWVLNKSDLLSGAGSPAMHAVGPDVNEFSIHPVQIEGASADHYMISTYWPGAATTSTVLHLFTVSGTPPAAVAITVTSLAMPTAAVPPTSPQAGSRNAIDSGDIRIADAVWSAGTLWFGFDEACPSDSTRACIRLGEITTLNDVLVQDFDIDVAGKYVFYPGLRVDAAGDLAVVFGYSSSTDYPGIMVGGRLAADPSNTLPQTEIAMTGSGPETPSNCRGTCRYGDYFGAARDPANTSLVWLVGEMGTPSGWSTHVFSVALQATLTVTYLVQGGGVDYAAPVLSYIHGGQLVQLALGTGANTLLMDPGTPWTISPQLPGSSAARREIWALNVSAEPAVGWANLSYEPLTFHYFHEFQVSLTFSVAGGSGSGAAPQVAAAVFGVPHVFSLPVLAYFDANTSFSYPTTLAGSTSTERWTTPLPGRDAVSAPLDLSIVYYHQVLMTFEFTVTGQTPSSAPQVHYTAYGGAASATLNATVWADCQSAYAYDEALFGATPGTRWGTGPNGNGTVVASETVSVSYREQFQVSVITNPSSLASEVSGAGWYDAGSSATLSIEAAGAVGWRFHGWSGDATGTASSVTFAVQRPMTVVAVFDAGLTIVAGDGGSVDYSYGTTSGTVPAGSTLTIYVPVGTVVSLTASAGSVSQAFAGWSGDASGNSARTSIQVNTPSVVTATFGSDAAVVVGLGILVVAVILGVALVLMRRRRGKGPRA